MKLSHKKSVRTDENEQDKFGSIIKRDRPLRSFLVIESRVATRLTLLRLKRCKYETIYVIVLPKSIEMIALSYQLKAKTVTFDNIHLQSY